MSNTKHTPGPWYVNADDSMQAVAVLGANDRGLAAVAGNSFDERKANGALIAAAPDMLAELKTLARIFRGYAEHHSNNGHHEKALANIRHTQRAEALIKKASSQ